MTAFPNHTCFIKKATIYSLTIGPYTHSLKEKLTTNMAYYTGCSILKLQPILNGPGVTYYTIYKTDRPI